VSTRFQKTTEGKRKLEGNMRVWNDNIKMYLKGKSFDFTLKSSTTTQWDKRDFLTRC
jgi:hypothetical protein